MELKLKIYYIEKKNRFQIFKLGVENFVKEQMRRKS